MTQTLILPAALADHIAQTVDSICTGAFESRYGSISWARIENYTRSSDADSKFVSALVTDEEDEPEPEGREHRKAIFVTPDIVLGAMKVMTGPTPIAGLDTEFREKVFGALMGWRDGGDFDAPAADIIVQVAVFGEVKYG